MKLEQRFLAVQKLLQPYHYLWEMEILERYPQPLPEWLNDWVQEVKNYSDQELLKLENKYSPTNPSESLDAYYKKINELACFEKVHTKTPKERPNFVNPKKHHEIAAINNYLSDKDFSHSFDFAGGMGHLSQAMGTAGICIDMDKALLTTGTKRMKSDIEFYHKDLTDNIHQEQYLLDKSHKNSICLGLHTCGPLSIYQNEFYLKSQAGHNLNFGCCYHKLDNEYNLSQVAQANPLIFTFHSLMLAARSNATIKLEDLHFRKRVKSYRYTLHMLLIDEGICEELLSLGNASKKEYQEDFPTYVKAQLVKVNIDLPLSDEAIQAYLDTKENLVNELMAVDLLRLPLGRITEIYLLIDRALYLAESGANVLIAEFFNKHISPRNLGIYSYKE